MNSVNDLNPSNLSKSTPTQTVSLNALRGNNRPTSKINIDATNGGVTGVAENTETRQTIRINPNRKKSSRRTIEDASEVNQINPNDYIPKQPQEQAPTRATSIQQAAMTKLDQAIARKKQEYIDFVNAATEADAYNRERIEEGFETVEGEINYMPSDYKQDPKEKAMEEEQMEEDDLDFYDREVEDTINDTSDIDTSAIVSDPFAMIEEDFEDLDEDDRTSFDDEDVNEEEYTEEMGDNNDEEESTMYDDPLDNLTPTMAYDYDREDEYEGDYPVTEEEEIIEETPMTKEEEIIEEPPVIEEKKEELDDNAIINDIASKSIKVSSQIVTDDNDINNSSTANFNVDEEDFEDLTYEGTNEEQLTDDQIRKIAIASENRLKNEILVKIIQAGKKLDTSNFVVSNKVISIKDALKGAATIKNTTERTGEWPMMFSGRPFRATALKGPEIALMADEDANNSESGVGLTLQQVRIMYEHDANPYKPKTIEAWAKTIPFVDIESIFAALYVASLKGANYIPMACPKPACMYSYLTDDIDINKLIKFGNHETEEKFKEIRSTPLTPDNTGKYESVVNIINDNFAIGLKIPSLFTILYEYASLNAAFTRKYSTVVNIMQYVDYIYKINSDTQSFEPIGWKVYAGDNGKTFKSKIATYAKILKEFDDTDFSILIALINSMVSKFAEARQISYEIPGAKCPKCGTDIPAREISPRQLLFTRQRLVELATTPIER